MQTPPAPAKPVVTAPSTTAKEIPFGVNEMRLNAWQWVITLVIWGLVLLLTPWVWGRLERFDVGLDYRIPYQLSKDYWLYGRRLRQVTGHHQVIVLGDSVVWGEYVAPDGTLSHFLNQEARATNRFVNLGLNGLFPLAQEGLVKYYGRALRHQKVIVQCNVLWMTSPKADLSSDKEEPFNHSRLVPQFSPRIPCYKADANERFSAVIQREVGFLQWVGHLQNACFGQMSLLSWTLEDDGASPPHYPNSYKNPLAQITFVVPSAPGVDPDRGPGSPRHKPWSSEGGGANRFDWVGLDSSLQWQAFRRVLETLRARGNDVLVILGPFNEHFMAEDNRPAYRKVRDGVEAWLTENHVPHVTPETLPSALYADDCHPLTEGYQLLAKRLYANPAFQDWLR
jgi:lysophospholipase L1-like esterase